MKAGGNWEHCLADVVVKNLWKTQHIYCLAGNHMTLKLGTALSD